MAISRSIATLLDERRAFDSCRITGYAGGVACSRHGLSRLVSRCDRPLSFAGGATIGPASRGMLGEKLVNFYGTPNRHQLFAGCGSTVSCVRSP